MEKQKLIYVESKALFSPSEVSDKAIVFIKDTKEIWTHGVYFSCSGTWATPITLSLTGDTTGSVSIDGSGNASIATTTNYLSIISLATDANTAANTKQHAVSYYRINSGSSNLFPVSNNANGILSLNVHDYSYTHLLGFSSNGNIYHRRRNGGTWETTWKTILSSSNYTNFPHTFASLTNKPTTLSGYGITDCIPIIKAGEITTDTDLSTLGMTTTGAKFSISHTTTTYPFGLHAYSNFLMFRSTSDTYSGIATDAFVGYATFIGGRNSETGTNNVPNWWFRIKGASKTTYDLNSILNNINNLDSNYLRKSGGTMTGILTLTTDSAYISDTQSGSAIFGTVSTSNTFAGISGLEAVFAGRLTNMVLRTSGDNLYHYNHSKSARYLILDTNNYSTYALPLSGGTMKGALNFANNTWNKVGDDAYMGDCDVAGMIGIKGSNAATPGFAMYNNSGTLLGKLYASGTSLYWSNAKILTSNDSVSEAYLAWGGRNLVDASSPIDTILAPILGANRLAFLSPNAIDIEYSKDSGTTWTDYNISDSNKVLLFAGGNNYTRLYLGGDSTQDASIDRTSWRLRITISAIGYSLYCRFLKFMIFVTDYGNALRCALLGRSYSNVQNNIDTWTTFLDTRLGGWSGWNTINHPAGILIPHTSHYGQIRFEFYMTSLGTTGTASCIQKIMGFASACWTWPSNMAGYGNIYSYDWQLNVTFPAKVAATGFSGNLTGNVTGKLVGNADTASKWKDARTITLTGDVTGSVTLDGSSNVTLTTATAGTGTTSFLKCLDKRNSYPALIVTSGGKVGAAFVHKSMLGGAEGTWYDAIILRGYVDDSAGNENALLFGKSTSSVYHSQYAFGSTTTWGTMYKFLDSNNYSSYALPLSGGTMTGAITLTSGADSAAAKSALSFIKGSDKSELARIGTDVTNGLGMYAKGDIYIRPNVTLDNVSPNGLVISSSSFTYNGTAVSLAGHTHSYLPLAGGTMTGKLTLTTNTSWIADSATSAIILGTFASGNTAEGLSSEAGVLVGKLATLVTIRSNGDDLWHYRNSDKKRYKILDAANYTNYTINYANTYSYSGYAGVVYNSKLYYQPHLSFVRFAPDDNSGNVSYELIAELTNYGTGTNTSYITYGISGFMWSYRSGNCRNSSAYPITAIVSVGPGTSSRLRVPSTTEVLIPVIVKYNDIYYLALKKLSSGTVFLFAGYLSHLLSPTIKVNDTSLIEEIKGPIEETSTSKYYYNNGTPQEYLHAGNYKNFYPIKLLYPRTFWGQSFDGTANVNGLINMIRDSSFTNNYNEGIRIQGTSALWAGIFLGTDGTTSGYIASLWNLSKTASDTFRISRGATSSSLLEILNSGNVGIGTSSPSEKLLVSGNAIIGGNVIVGTDSTNSSITIKSKNIGGVAYLNFDNGYYAYGDLYWKGYIAVSGYGDTSMRTEGNGLPGEYLVIHGMIFKLPRIDVGSFAFRNGRDQDVARISSRGVIIAKAGFKVSEGTSSQFLKADGSLDSTSYLPTAGGTLGNSTASFTDLFIKSSTAKLRLTSFTDSTTYIQSGNSDFTGNATLKITGYNSNTGSKLYFSFANIYCRAGNYTNIDSGNYSNYAIKIDGTNGTADGVSTLLNKLTTGTATPVDADYYICQYAGGGTTTTSYVRRPISALYTYIKSKLSLNPDEKFIYATSATSNQYGTTEATGSSSTLTRTLFWRDNDRALIGMYVQHSDNLNYGFELASSYSSVGSLTYRRKFSGTWGIPQIVLTSSNYNNYSPTLTGTGASGTWAINISGVAASASKVANALTIQLNGGTTAGTNKFVYDGSSAYTINITPEAIGASATNHTHDYLPLSGGILGSGAASITGLGILSNTTGLLLVALSDTNYIQSGNSDFSGNATLKITGYSSNTGSDLYFNFANIYCRAGNYTNIDSGNYSTYALPLSGGTLTGTLISRDIRPSANLSYSLGTSSYYYNYVYANYFKKNGSSDSYVLLGGGGHKAVSDFAPNNVATLSSSGMGNSDLWTLVFEKSYPDYWYSPTTMFYIRSASAGCGILCFYNYWASGTKLDAYEKEVWFFGAGKSETGITFGGSNRDINDYFRIYIDTANCKYYMYYNRYNDLSLRILELLFFTVPEPGEYLSTGSLRSSFFTNSTTVVDLPTESSTLVRVPIKTTYNHDRTIRTTKSVYASSFYENSDIRLKENVRGIDLSDLTKLVDLVQFNFKDSGTKKYGVIAQLLELVGLQNLVYENNGNKAVDYISLLVLEIQRLRNEIGELKLEINKKS